MPVTWPAFFPLSGWGVCGHWPDGSFTCIEEWDVTHKFKIGDRVRCLSDSHGVVAPGTLGVVTELDYVPYVQWENLTDPYALMEDEMDLVETLDLAIGRYQSACVAFEQAQEALERAKQAVADARIDIGRALESEP
jgi:hypothetical protein